MEIRYYVDADILSLAHLLLRVRADLTYPGDPGGRGIDRRDRPPSPVPLPATPDVDWIPVVAQRGWVVLTRDRHMVSRPQEREQILASGARHVRIEGAPGVRKLRAWDQLEILMVQWRAIERLGETPGPWVYVATRSRLRKEL